MQQIPIDRATKTQLIQFASEALGVEIHPNTGAGKVRAKIRTAWRADYITLYNEPEKALEVTTVTTAPHDDDAPIAVEIRALHGGSSKNDPKVRLYVNEAQGPGGSRPVFVSVNNVPMLLPRGEEVDVPYRYYLALKAAVRTLHEQDDETYVINPRDVPSYPFSVVRLPSKEEMEGWDKREYEAQYPVGEAPPMQQAVY
jgi:hypothetical protein